MVKPPFSYDFPMDVFVERPRLPPGAVGPGSWSTVGMLREAWRVVVAAESLGGVVQHGGAGSGESSRVTGIHGD